MTLLSQTALEQLDHPHRIDYSRPKLIFFTALLGVFSVFFLFGGLKILLMKGGLPTGLVCVGLGVLILLAMVFRTLPSWRGLGGPAVTISKDGLRFGSEPLIPWSAIEENDWHSASVMGLTSAAQVHFRANGRKRKIQALFFKCDGDEYLHYCNLYQAASQQGRA